MSDENTLAFTDDSVEINANKIAGATFNQSEQTITVSANEGGTITIQITGGDDITSTDDESKASIVMAKDSMIFSVGEKMKMTMGSDGIIIQNGDDMSITLGSSDMTLKNTSGSSIVIGDSTTTIDSGSTVTVSSSAISLG
jgi:hypothetical protein